MADEADETEVRDRWCRGCDGLCTEYEIEMYGKCQTCWMDE